MVPYGETTALRCAGGAGGGKLGRPTRTAGTVRGDASPRPAEISDFDAGFLIGVLVGEGHFGGDGRQPQVTLRMHADHVALFEWLIERFPDSRLYGPYDHSGRRYYQWMARGRFLRETLMPLLRINLRPEHSGRVWARFLAMCQAYRLGGAGDEPASGPPG